MERGRCVARISKIDKKKSKVQSEVVYLTHKFETSGGEWSSQSSTPKEAARYVSKMLRTPPDSFNSQNLH